MSKYTPFTECIPYEGYDIWLHRDENSFGTLVIYEHNTCKSIYGPKIGYVIDDLLEEAQYHIDLLVASKDNSEQVTGLVVLNWLSHE